MVVLNNCEIMAYKFISLIDNLKIIILYIIYIFIYSKMVRGLLPHSAQLGTQLKLSSSLQASTCKLGHRVALLSSGTGRPAGRPPAGRPPQCLRYYISAFTDQIRTKLQNLIHGIISNICHGDICPCNICPDNNCHGYSDAKFF